MQRVKTSGYIIGRNGIYDLSGVTFFSYKSGNGKNSVVKIDGISLKGKEIINGGLEIEAEAMTKLALGWLKEQGFKVTLTVK